MKITRKRLQKRATSLSIKGFFMRVKMLKITSQSGLPGRIKNHILKDLFSFLFFLLRRYQRRLKKFKSCSIVEGRKWKTLQTLK